MALRKYAIELIGTFFLVLTVALTGNPVAIGAILVAMVYMGGYISGAHFNPAVTLAVWLRGRMNGKDAGLYMLAQLIGAILAAGVFYGLAHSAFIPAANEQFATWTVTLLEALFTFALASVVLHVSTSDQIKDNYYYGIAIGLTLLAGVYSVGQLTGGVFNPALGLGTLIVDSKEFIGHGAKLGNYLLAYLVGPFVGAALATGVYRFINGPAKKAHHAEA